MRIIYSTCVTVFFLNSPTIKVTEGSCCSLHEASWTWWQRSKFFASHLLWACRQGLPQLPRNATQQGQWSQQPKSSHSLKYSARLKFSVDPQMCNEFYCNSAFTAFIVFNCREIGLVAVVLRHHNLLSPASPPFYLFLRILFHYSPLLLSHNYSSFRLLPSPPPLLDGKGVPQEPPHHVDAHPRAAHVGSAVAHLSRKLWGR